MIFRINETHREMFRNCRGISQDMQYYIDRKVIIADTDQELKDLQRVVVRRYDVFYNLHMYDEAKRYMELAMMIREKRNEMAKGKTSPLATEKAL